MPKLISDGIIKNYNKVMRKVIKDLSKCITVYNDPTSVNCFNCLFDNVHKKSSGVRDWSAPTDPYTVFSGTQYEATYYQSQTNFNRSRCPVCLGEGKLYMPSTTDIQVLVTWQFSSSAQSGGNQLRRQLYWPVGLQNKFSCRIKTNSCHFDLIKEAEYFEVDSYKMKLWENPSLEGLGAKDGILIAYLIDAKEEFLPEN